jgi:Recombination endonuclease VII
MRRITPEQATEIARLYESGTSMNSIASQFGTYRDTIRRSLKNSGVERRVKHTRRPESEWIMCACGVRAIYQKGLCRTCYNLERNKDPEVQDRRFTWKLKKYFGMSREEYDTLLASQGGVCAICKQPEPRGIRLCIDHDHACCPSENSSCGKCVRGLLCVSCNRALGYLHDNIGNAENLISYLKKYRSP